jgi:hypothetical protein
MQKRSRNQKRSMDPQDTALVYTGPIRSLKVIQERQTLTKVLGYWVQLSASAGGIVNSIITLLPSNSPLWSTEWVGWDEYRLLAAQVQFYATNSSGVQPMVACVDFDDHSTALSSQSGGLNYGSGKVISCVGSQKKNRLTYRMAQAPYSTFTTTGTSPSQPPGSFKTYSSNNSSSVQTYQAFVSYVVQFRASI